MFASNEPPLPTTITSLPTELIIKIVLMSSPKPSWDNAVERLTHNNFPNLKYLYPSTRYGGNAPSPMRILHPLGGQLSALSLKDLSVNDIPHLKPEIFPNLHTLHVELPLADLTSFLSSLPTEIRHLRVAADSGPSTYEWTKEFINTNFIERNQASLRTLETLNCASDMEEPWRPFVWSSSKRGRGKLQARLEERRSDIKIKFYHEDK
ncbi:hypothetical protein RQP46_010881 [Phenoliferia psychrophenolica]